MNQIAAVQEDPEQLRKKSLRSQCVCIVFVSTAFIPLWVHASSSSYSEEKKEATSTEIDVFTALLVMTGICSSMCIVGFCIALFQKLPDSLAEEAIKEGTVGNSDYAGGGVWMASPMGQLFTLFNYVVGLTTVGLLCAWRMLRGGSNSGYTLGVCVGVFGSLCLCNLCMFFKTQTLMADLTSTSFALQQRATRKQIELVKLFEDGTIRLLSCSWLLTSGVEHLVRCQDLPPEAFLSPTQAMKAFQQSMVYVLSYGWLMGGNPDPFGVRVRTVQQFLRSGCPDPSSWGLFWDFACLPQNPNRTPYMIEIFGKGLGMMSMLYGSVRTTVLILKEILEPPAGEEVTEGYNRTPYDIRGWCIMESTVAAFAAFYANKKELLIEISQDAAPNIPAVSLPNLTEAEERLATARFTCGKEDEERVMKQLREFNATLPAETAHSGAEENTIRGAYAKGFEDGAQVDIYITSTIKKQPEHFSWANFFEETSVAPTTVNVSSAPEAAIVGAPQGP